MYIYLYLLVSQLLSIKFSLWTRGELQCLLSGEPFNTRVDVDEPLEGAIALAINIQLNAAPEDLALVGCCAALHGCTRFPD